VSHLQITLRSGVQVTADATTVTTGRSPMNGELTKLEWDQSGATRLVWVRLEEVAAIVFHDTTVGA
jgi:hypothetical protein